MTKPKAGRFSPIVWGQALFATALVGAAPVLVLFVVPLGLGNQEKQQPLLRVFLSFAAGGLLGDALLHLLPHSLPEGAGHAHDHGHNHDHEGPGHSHSMADLYVWLWTLAGMLTFLMLEKFVRAQTGGHGHSHGHAHPSASVQDGGASPVSNKATTTRKRTVFKESKDDAEVPDNEPITSLETGKKPIAAAGYLNLAADFSHNFTDGLAIGATFLRGTGWTTTVAMLLHELPHEIGDFAILIQSGFTRREAMATQLLTAIGAMIGTVIGLLMEGAGDSSSVWISPFTAGGFIYIACTSVMPELLEDCSLAQSLKEAVAMCAGIGLMALIALSE
ncbi:Zinc (Zn2)-Iron (Fe2) Permease (ZIP) Family [Phytophthora palmivora]|uniref:Zinc (Zn2)-Iron (Fe2) Permease (ZIP) Family n=1 Tax=Phytophthora palmivora TaxID=4796 RepID=A0A2P4YP52_9STRA|nr:Zinc (Zn2)-Iron (Fe2) Permease (ZIP) Family [Phytophthora palmivora]